MYKPIADFPISGIFVLSKFEEGLPKSIILQKEQLDEIEAIQAEKNQISSQEPSINKQVSTNGH